MQLPEALRKQKEGFINSAPPETVKIMKNATEDLYNSGILNNCLQVGDAAPDFTLENAAKTPITLSDMLDSGPVILKFFRGDW